MFVSLVAHEVKSPLAATEGWLNLILSRMLKHDEAEEKRMIQRSLLRVRTLRSMVNELLNLTAIETGNFTLNRRPVDVVSVAAEAAAACAEKAAEKNITVSAAPPAGPVPNVLADRDALSIICSNLVENAIKYGRDNGRVEVRVAAAGMYVTLVVTDDGIGMSPEDRAKIFDEFFRARNEVTASIPGTGLGLSLVKRLTELHQGTVAVESVLGSGSTFTVSLPALGGPPGAVPLESQAHSVLQGSRGKREA
jgi:signal transduction histidine kinase